MCALTRTILLSYRGISLSFHLVTVLFQLVTSYFTFPLQFQLNSDFSHTFEWETLNCTFFSSPKKVTANSYYGIENHLQNVISKCSRFGGLLNVARWIDSIRGGQCKIGYMLLASERSEIHTGVTQLKIGYVCSFIYVWT